MPENKKIIFFTSPIGLGHATRDLAVATHLKNNRVQVVFVTGGKAAEFLSNAGESVQDVYSPPTFNINPKTGRLEGNTKWLISYYRYYKRCKIIADNIIRGYIKEQRPPDMIVSDEDFASLVVSHKLKIKSAMITDILETKFAKKWPSTYIEKKLNDGMRDIMNKCNLVIMPEKGNNNGNIHRVGPITRAFSDTRDELRKMYKFAREEKVILISVGGTDVGRFVISKAQEAAAAVAKGHNDSDVRIVVVPGPSIDMPQFGNYNHKHIRIINSDHTNCLHDMILASDVLVSLAGRSTIDEAHAAGTPSVFIPIKGHFEQEQNAAEYGFKASDVNRLEEIISEKISQRRDPLAVHQGAKEAADIIMSH